MSGDLISRSAVIKVLEECNLDRQLFEKDVFDKVEVISQIEAVPVVRGEWKEYEEVGSRGYHYCSKCKYPAFKRDFCGRSIEKLSNFCPNCGAKMKGGAEW